MARAEWLQQNQPALPTADQVDNDLVNLAQAANAPSITTEDLKLLEQQPKKFQFSFPSKWSQFLSTMYNNPLLGGTAKDEEGMD